jgi:hypothetical protein
MINRIEPDTLTTPVITPHMHKHWHLISEMPDLNEELQEEQEKGIFKALILGLLYKLIQRKPGGRKYSLKLDNRKQETQFTVSNGTVCDTFYQIVDALTINPVNVKDIHTAVIKKMETARKNNIIKYEESPLYKGLMDLKLEELSGDENKVISIFGIAAAYKATMPPDEFIMDHGLSLMETILETLYEQIEVLCPENERITRFVELIKNQLELFAKNFDIYAQRHPSVLDGYLQQLIQVVIKVLNDKELIDAIDWVINFSNNLFSNNKQSAQKKLQPKEE